MGRRLFCEICPFFYQISVMKNRGKRHLYDFFSNKKFASVKQEKKLPVLVFEHKSMIRRKLKNVDFLLQENKEKNLSLAAPKVNGILIRPGETFSFWHLVGKTSAAKGYKEGLTISCGRPDRGIGGGLCQFTNLIHWMVLHSPLLVREHHHHDQLDLFPDYKRTVPFGTGTSIMYNYLDYRFVNRTDQTFQICVRVKNGYLWGELRCEKPLNGKYRIVCEDERFVQETDGVYRIGTVYKEVYEKESEKLLYRRSLRKNHAKVMYEMEATPEFENRV